MEKEGWMQGVEQSVPFSMVPYGLIEDERCGVYHIALFTALARFANYKTGECWPSMPTLSVLTGMSERKMRDVVADLVEWGWMSVIRRKGDDGRNLSNYYRLHNSSGTGSENRRHDVPGPAEQDAGKREPLEREPKNYNTRANSKHPQLEVPINETRYQTLCGQYSQPVVDEAIQERMDWEAANGKKPAKDYAAAASNWLKNAAKFGNNKKWESDLP